VLKKQMSIGNTGNICNTIIVSYINEGKIKLNEYDKLTPIKLIVVR